MSRSNIYANLSISGKISWSCRT